jgi:hypothetical protein
VTVKELQNKLAELPGDSDVWYLWDGEARTEVEFIYLAKSGKVILTYYWTRYQPDLPYSVEDQPVKELL